MLARLASIALLCSLAACGSSSTTCTTGQILCGSFCVDTTTDTGNCGGCGNVCDSNEICASSSCQPSCPQGQVSCGGLCIDPATNGNFCGATGDCMDTNMGTVCDLDATCTNGACVAGCQTGFIACGGGCIDPATNNTYCGASGDCTGTDVGTPCTGAGQICMNGVCTGATGTTTTLANLTLSAGLLDPLFSPGTTAYVVTAPVSATSITVTPVAGETNDFITVNGAPVASGAPSAAIALTVIAPTTITIHVTNASLQASTYTILVASEHYLKAANTRASALFGASIAISGNTLAIGSPGESSDQTGVGANGLDSSAASAGAVYVFTRIGGVWTPQAYIKASNTGAGDAFGTSVALDGTTLVVGAPGEDSSGAQSDDSASNAGAAYVFTYDGTAWSQQAYVKASDASAGDAFGTSVSISADTIVVGAIGRSTSTGAAYVFTRTSGTWSQQAILAASNAGTGDLFGTSLDLDADTIVVGAPGEASASQDIDGDGTDNSAMNAGAAYVFVRASSVWTQQAYLKASNAAASYAFGGALSLSADTVVVGSTGDASGTHVINGNESSVTAPSSGAAYVFVRAGTSWSQQAYLKTSNGESNDLFGSAVALDGDALAVSALGEAGNGMGTTGNPANDGDANAGAVYVFARNNGSWSQSLYLKASNPDAGDQFGAGLSIDGTDLVVGAAKEASDTKGVDGDQADDSDPSAGATYCFVL